LAEEQKGLLIDFLLMAFLSKLYVLGQPGKSSFCQMTSEKEAYLSAFIPKF
jgi:hypothetical protein